MNTETMRRNTMKNNRSTMTRSQVQLHGAQETTLVIETDYDTVSLKVSDGNLATLKVSNHMFGSSFAHLDDDALAALQYQIEAYFARKEGNNA